MCLSSSDITCFQLFRGLRMTKDQADQLVMGTRGNKLIVFALSKMETVAWHSHFLSCSNADTLLVMLRFYKIR